MSLELELFFLIAEIMDLRAYVLHRDERRGGQRVSCRCQAGGRRGCPVEELHWHWAMGLVGFLGLLVGLSKTRSVF